MPLATPYVLAAPGYLAGGNAWEHLTEWLLRGHGWRDASTIDYHTLLVSPDGSLHVGLDRRGAWTWHLHAASPAGRHWIATLGTHLPVEYVTALVETMLRPGTRHRPDVLGPLYAAGWTRDTEADAIAAVSPDGLVRFTQENAAGPSPHAWHAACTVDGYTWWTATFTAHPAPARRRVHPQPRQSRPAAADGHRDTDVPLRAPHPPYPNRLRLGRRTSAARSTER